MNALFAVVGFGVSILQGLEYAVVGVLGLIVIALIGAGMVYVTEHAKRK